MEKWNFHTITNGINSSHFNSVKVSGEDVYVAGSESNGTNDIAKIWKNGIANNLSDGTKEADANGVIVLDNDVYAAATNNNSDDVMLWKNGNPAKSNLISILKEVWLL
jgi:hypothetical protein